ncbi:MAG: UbiA family prenyltransferase [Deltaproteobacteria bacterium]|nr:UbiA family prenyltransferase [Deltaproteobacteria bacterium]
MVTAHVKIFAFIRLLRPHEWVRNVLIFAPLAFAGELFNAQAFISVLGAALLFSLLASAVYVMNDMADAERDCLHPQKRLRPLAHGDVTRRTAGILCLVLLGAVFVLSAACYASMILVFALYLLLQISYSFKLKEVAILDVVSPALGYVLRIWAGIAAASVPFSLWMVAVVFLLGFFIVLSKRRQEIAVLKSAAPEHRKSLAHYTLSWIDQMLGIAAASIIIAYMLYTLDEQTVAKFGNGLFVTNIFVFFGILRYLWHVQERILPNNPLSLFVKDKFLLATIFLWGVSALMVIYGS